MNQALPNNPSNHSPFLGKNSNFCADHAGREVIGQEDKIHLSDCALYNGPAYEPQPCDCKGLYLTENSDHLLIIPTITQTGCERPLIREAEDLNLIEKQKFPVDGFLANASTTYLPDTHDLVSGLTDAHSVDFNQSIEPIVVDQEAHS